MSGISEPATGRDVLALALGSRKRALAGASLLLASHQAAEAAVPVLIGVVIDRAIEPGSGAALVFWLAAVALLFAALSLSFRFGSRLGQRVALLAEHRLRLAIVRGVLEQRGRADGLLPGAVLSLASSDASRVAFLNVGVAATVAALAALAVAAAVLLTTSLVLGLLVLAGLPPLLAVLHLIAAPLERRSLSEQAAAAEAAGLATDLVSGLRVLKGLGAEAAAAGRYRRASRTSLQATMRAAIAQAVYDGAALGAVGVFLAAVALVGGRLAAEGRIGIGQLVAALGLSQFLIGPIGRLSSTAATFAQARASATRIADVLNPAARPDPVGIELADGAFSVEQPGLSLTARRGEIVGLAAEPAAAGRLVAELGGVDDERLLVVPHDADLFSGSLIDNVRAAARSSQLVRAALTAAAVDEVAASLPDGAESEVGERGRRLSGGQLQRVALARALAADPAVLVLHDPTTAVDSVTEAQVAAGIRELRRDGATLLVTTSPALLACCDRVVHLDRAGTASEGTHRTLLERVPAYRELVLA